MSKIKSSWLKISSKHADNGVGSHELVPDHRVLSNKEIQDVFDEYGISKTDLPIIKPDDPAIEEITCFPGDVLEIVRDSRTAETARSYRYIEPVDGAKRGDATEWEYNPDVPDEKYTPEEDLNATLSRHILGNMGASMPPTNIGSCRWVAVDRETEIEKAESRGINKHDITFIEGELGFGKSFFLYWLRDRLADKSAVSIVDLDKSVGFESPETIVRAVRDNIHTPRSISHSKYANGMDELWDTYVSSVISGTVDHLKERGFELTEDLVSPNVTSAIHRSLEEMNTSGEILDKNKLQSIAESYINQKSSYQSFSSEFPDNNINNENAFDVLNLLSSLAEFQNMPVVIGIDELEKADRSEDHFAAINEFIENTPPNVSVFVTGTPELIDGTESKTGIKNTHQQLYDLFDKNRISLDNPSEKDLRTFTNKLTDAEELVEGANKYSKRVEEAGSIDDVVRKYANSRNGKLTFRSYIQHFEDN